MEETGKLYVMISKTDTGIGGLIRKITGFPYNHVSMTLDPTFRTWVSFARFIHDTPMYGGFLTETAERFLAKGQDVDVHIFALDLIPQRFKELKELFSKAGHECTDYIYNYFELLTLVFGIQFPIRGAYTCLGFANRIMGTNYKTIQELDRNMQSMLYYTGTLNELAPDSGDRSDIYFPRLGPIRGIYHTVLTFGELIRRTFTKQTTPASPTAVN